MAIIDLMLEHCASVANHSLLFRIALVEITSDTSVGYFVHCRHVQSMNYVHQYRLSKPRRDIYLNYNICVICIRWECELH